MSLNNTKSNTLHFRTNSIARINFTFTYGQADFMVVGESVDYLALVCDV